jgi:high-affinity Fe2+/Pb2+ permease
MARIRVETERRSGIPPWVWVIVAVLVLAAIVGALIYTGTIDIGGGYGA